MDAWTTITPKRNKSRKPHRIDPKAVALKQAQQRVCDDVAVVDPRKLADSALKLSEIFERSDFCLFAKSMIERQNIVYERMIVLGLGNFSRSQSALLQLVFALCVNNAQRLSLIKSMPEKGPAKIESFEYRDGVEDQSTETILPPELFLFDPVFTESEVEAALLLNISVIASNEKGKISVNDRTTLLFMPHCPYRLYCNVLWKNWDHLDVVQILGNSFSSYELRRFVARHDDPLDCVRFLSPLGIEHEVWSSHFNADSEKWSALSHLENAFSDLSLQLFPRSRLESERAAALLAQRPAEEAVDLAASEDEELR